ncbi:ATP-binding cassette domain-containing protein [Salicibibacter cibi]|uniref:UvrABC system protein A n=1 Tax=Salicibibacter cibi TaxID=2743001 RepID=A0A7T6ZC53_9BACI|nr:ATP-binding cassette domain-containing protein [Salicibibacter cibi]QQK80662.1 ATP-binding cassette domain-containing protein [Salicibibacter cibi]
MNIKIKNAYEKNLKNIDLEIQRNKLTVITGLSGSGKTTLLKDTIYIESQRQYLETMSYQGIPKPKVDEIKNLSPAIMIDQEDRNDNPRSTLGTQTDIYTDLRMIFEKLHQRNCPNCHKVISASDSMEETEKIDGEFNVYMHCPNCNYQMDKLTRSHFSFNTRAGACPTCKGMGKSLVIKDSLYQKNKTILNGGIATWHKNYADYQLKSFNALLKHLSVPIPKDIPLGEFTQEQFDLLKKGIYSSEIPEDQNETLPTKVAEGKYEGVEPKIWQKIAEEKDIPKNLKEFVQEDRCFECHGEKLNALSRSAKVYNHRLPEIVKGDLKHALQWVQQLKKQSDQQITSLVKDYLLDIEIKINRISKLGLDYLSLDRQYSTLSGGEAQRIKLAAVLDSQMTELIIILDEPTVGLHTSDTEGLISMINEIKGRNNTIIAIEHDEAFSKQADYIVEIGPGSGEFGGNVVTTGTYDELLTNSQSLLFKSNHSTYQQASYKRKTKQLALEVQHANVHNLKNISLTLPADCLSVITGVSGSGKSSLLFGEIADSQLKDNEIIQWKNNYKDIVVITQKRPTRNKRSIIATYLDVFDDIRYLFAIKSKDSNLPYSVSDFSFNSGQGRCPNCQGLGVVESNQLFFENMELPCSTCHGSRYKDEISNVKIEDYSISDVLAFSIKEAIEFFERNGLNSRPLFLLTQTNLDYILLGQGTGTLSGGEMQRLRLTSTISKQKGNKHLFILDEPTTGMHKIDVFHFMELIQKLTENENTFFFIEHNLDVIKQADYIVELGPSGGDSGGEIIYSGDISQFIKANTKTLNYL